MASDSSGTRAMLHRVTESAFAPVGMLSAMSLNEPGTRAELWDEAFLPALKDSKESVQQGGIGCLFARLDKKAPALSDLQQTTEQHLVGIAILRNR